MVTRQVTVVSTPDIVQAVGVKGLVIVAVLITAAVGIILIPLGRRRSSGFAAEILVCVCYFAVAGALMGVGEHFWRISADGFDPRALLSWTLSLIVLLMLGGYLKRRD